jgi:hypothetical protein
MSKSKAATSISRTEIKALPGHIHVGEFCEHFGGVYVGVVRGCDCPDYHLFVPPDAAAQTSLPWGGYEHDEPGAKSERDGLANTLALCESKIEHPAAKFARSLELYGLKDYYLPSREELRLCFINCRALFEPQWYWSSTQSSPDSAWVQNFNDGYQYLVHKDIPNRVRAVRRVLVIQ